MTQTICWCFVHLPVWEQMVFIFDPEQDLPQVHSYLLVPLSISIVPLPVGWLCARKSAHCISRSRRRLPAS